MQDPNPLIINTIQGKYVERFGLVGNIGVEDRFSLQNISFTWLFEKGTNTPFSQRDTDLRLHLASS